MIRVRESLTERLPHLTRVVRIILLSEAFLLWRKRRYPSARAIERPGTGRADVVWGLWLQPGLAERSAKAQACICPTAPPARRVGLKNVKEAAAEREDSQN